MASKKDSEVEKSVDLVQEVNVGELVNGEDPVKEVILAVMKIVLWEEERALVSDINEYRNNLSRHLLNRLSELPAHPVDMTRFGASFKAGWQERGIFLCRVPECHDRGHRDIVRETVFSSITCCFQSPLDGQYLGEWGKNRHVNTWIHG